MITLEKVKSILALRGGARPMRAALCLVGFASGMIALASTQSIGALSRMGPGFLPLVTGLALLVCATLTVLRGTAVSEPSSAGTPAGACVALAGICVFALIVEFAGVLLASAALGICAARAAGLTPMRAALVGVAVGPATALLLAFGLKVPFRLAPLF